jgi:uncharacterized phage-associated protein
MVLGTKQRIKQKTLESLLLLANKEQRVYWLLKMLYFAEKDHLSKYGRMICEDTYYAKEHGPVPMLAEQIIESSKGGSNYEISGLLSEKAIIIQDANTVRVLRKANEYFLSQSEVESLTEAYEKYKDFSQEELEEASHDSAYKAAEKGKPISFDKIVESLSNSQDVLEHLHSI